MSILVLLRLVLLIVILIILIVILIILIVIVIILIVVVCNTNFWYPFDFVFSYANDHAVCSNKFHYLILVT